MTAAVLLEVSKRTAHFLVIDVTGVAVMDTSTADQLLELAGSVSLLGAECVICGIQPAVAQTLVAIGVDLTSVTTTRNLQRALDYCVERGRTGSR
jgi:rsbT co-antagonist protein RsbR